MPPPQFLSPISPFCMAVGRCIFVDASAFIALVVSSDTNHAKAVDCASRIEKEGAILVTTSMVIAEVLTVLAMRIDKQLALACGEKVRAGGITIVHVNDDIFERAWRIFVHEKSKNVSFVDCLSFALIALQHIPAAFSFDHDFRHRDFSLIS